MNDEAMHVAPSRARATIKHVAERAGVSFKTVSRVLNGVDSVAPEIRERVEAAVRDTGYIPNARARSLKAGVAESIGLVVDSLADPFFASFMAEVEELALSENLGLLITGSGVDPDREKATLKRFAGEDVQGVIIAPVGNDLSYLRQFAPNTPVVMVDRVREGFDAIVVADEEATRSAVTALLGAGHTRIGVIGYDPRFTTSKLRLRGFHHAFEEAGIEISAELRQDPAVQESAAASMQRFLALPEPPTAVFGFHPHATMAAIEALHRHGHLDIAVSSFGDIAMGDVVTPAVSYVQHDPVLIARLTFERLMRRIQNPNLDVTTIVAPTRYVQRTTTRELDERLAGIAP